MSPNTGTPPAPGRYLMWTRAASPQIPEWTEPHLAYFDGARWHGGGNVLGWIGPIPPFRVADFPQSYDL